MCHAHPSKPNTLTSVKPPLDRGCHLRHRRSKRFEKTCAIAGRDSCMNFEEQLQDQAQAQECDRRGKLKASVVNDAADANQQEKAKCERLAYAFVLFLDVRPHGPRRYSQCAPIRFSQCSDGRHRRCPAYSHQGCAFEIACGKLSSAEAQCPSGHSGSRPVDVS